MNRRLPGFALVAGGVLTAVAIAPVGRLNFFWLPLFLGGTYLAAALASRSRSRPLWAAGVITAAFGLEAELTYNGTLHGVPLAPGEILSLGVGLLVVAVLTRYGFAADPLGVAVTVLSLGVLYYGADKDWASGLFGKPVFYGGLVAAYGIFELLRSRPRSRR